jgi:DNA-binding MarR family transcriptional regulator
LTRNFLAGHTGDVSPEEVSQGNAIAAAAAGPAGSGSRPSPSPGPGSDPAPASWAWPDDARAFPPDAPLQALMLSATKLLGAYGQFTVTAAGLKVSVAGLGVLRVLMGADGLKASEVADRAWSSPGTLTAVVNTLVRDGFVQRRADAEDRRVVRLYISDQGRAVITYYVSEAAPRWRKAFDFVDSGDETVVRGFFVQMIGHLGQLMREERGR